MCLTAGVLVHGFHQGVQRLVAVGCEKRRFDRVFWEKEPMGVAAFDKPVGIEQDAVAGRPGRGEGGEVILQALRQVAAKASDQPQ